MSNENKELFKKMRISQINKSYLLIGILFAAAILRFGATG
jgi:hypothetical protein